MVEELQIFGAQTDDGILVTALTDRAGRNLATDVRPGPIVAIGKFDGAHLGHRALANEARELASNLGSYALALTFSPHPQRYFSPEQPFFQLMQDELRAHRLQQIGFDALAILPFDAKLANLPAEDFLHQYLHNALKARAVVVGADFRFGAKRAGDAELIATTAKSLGIQARFVAPQTLPTGEIISSSAIRLDLASGNVARANAMLGYEYSVLARVIHGEKRGRELGYPTANLKLDQGCALKHGIYAVRIHHGERRLKGVASFGRRPTFDNGAPLLEVHIFDFSETLYDQMLEISFHAYLREELKFTDINQLVMQMDADSVAARAILASEVI